MYHEKLLILQLTLIAIYSISAQNLNSNKPANSTLSQNLTKQDSNITWIKISPLISNTSVETFSEDSGTNCAISEYFSNETQNLDISSGLRRKRRKRRRNKYKAWNQRRPEHSYKKHSTRVELNKPVQFLVPPDYQENLIPKEFTYHKSRNNVEKFIPSRTEKKIPSPVRHLLPPVVDTRFINLIESNTPALTSALVQKDPKKSKYIDWSSNSTNRGSTKFKHTIYYSDSGNEIISNYEVTSTTPVSRVEYTTSNDDREFILNRSLNEIPRNPSKLEYRPIVVQPTPIQYSTQISIQNHTIGFPSRDTRIDSLVSVEVANAGMQVINMTRFQIQNQFVQSDNYKQFESSPLLRSTQPQRIPLQQSAPQSIYQQYKTVQDTFHQGNYQQTQLQQSDQQLLSANRLSEQINNQQSKSQPQNYQQFSSLDRIPQQVNYQNPSFQQQSEIPDRVPQQINYQPAQSQQQQNYQPAQSQQQQNYQQSQSLDRIPQQINYQQSPNSDQTPQQIYQQSSQHQRRKNQNLQSNILHSQAQQQISQQINYSQYQTTQFPLNASSRYKNLQKVELLHPHQMNNEQSLHNYQQTTNSRTFEPRETTLTPRMINNLTIPQTDKSENFKGLDLAESKYFSDVPSEQEFNAVQNDGQVIPGIAGKDYPVFDQFLLQKRRFSCHGLEGYFADVASRCQIFYICNGDGAGEPMLCPNGTLFSQELLVCDWWYNVDC